MGQSLPLRRLVVRFAWIYCFRFRFRQDRKAYFGYRKSLLTTSRLPPNDGFVPERRQDRSCLYQTLLPLPFGIHAADESVPEPWWSYIPAIWKCMGFSRKRHVDQWTSWIDELPWKWTRCLSTEALGCSAEVLELCGVQKTTASSTERAVLSHRSIIETNRKR